MPALTGEDLLTQWLSRRPRAPESHILDGGSMPLPNDLTSLTLIEAQAACGPGRRALVHGETELSFAELDGKANALAAQLKEHGAGRNALVPIICGNCIELPIAMLAILKAGAAFVPIDADWPAARLASVLETLRPPVALLDPAAAESVAVDVPGIRVDHREIAQQATCRDRLPDFQEDLIYGFFTSGSTGTPKCCLNIHRGVLNRFLCMTRRFGSQPGDVVLQNSKHIFDSSIWQILWPLTNGHTVVIPNREGLLDLDATIDIIARHKVTMADFVPSIFNIMVEMLKASPRRVARLTSLRRLLIGGEEISAKAVQEFRRLLPHVGITNTYGPTEASIGMVFHDVDEADGGGIPLGKPIENTFAFVAGEGLEPLPHGEIGEIVIGGECLGAGYLHEPEKTAEAFPPNPFVNLHVRRLYRTGDLGCVDSRGCLRFRGRKDFQVKIDGVRVELGEIEQALLNFETVREAKVVARQGGDGRNQLVAFVAVTAEVDTGELRARLADSLPPASIPRRVVALEEMPLTANGKIDRRRLMEMLDGPERGDVAESRDAGTEATILRILREAFERPAIGLDDDFFDLGGDSLQAIKVSLKLGAALGREVMADDVYRHASARALAGYLDGGDAGTGGGDRQDEEARARSDAELAADLPPLPAAARPGDEPPRELLLTGATGFIGAHLLAELLCRTPARIHCLVRADDADSAAARLRRTLQAYDLPVGDLDSRVAALPADLARPRLGLDEDRYAALAETIDTVVHNGAVVDFLLDYDALRDANVLGTLELLKLARSGHAKRFHQVSSLSVFPHAPDDGVRIDEACAPPRDAQPDDAYSKTKWVGEHLVCQARATGSPARVYRLGEVMPGTRSGHGNPRSLLLRLVKAAALLGVYPDIDMAFDHTPVDLASRALVAGVRQCRQTEGDYHLFNPRPATLARLMAELAGLGIPLRLVPYGEFWHALKSACSQGKGNPDLLALLSVLPPPAEDRERVFRHADNVLTRFASPARHFRCDAASRLAAGAGIDWPELSGDLLRPFAERLRAQIADRQR